MSFLELAKKRYSVRKYQEKMVEEEKLLLKSLKRAESLPLGQMLNPKGLLLLERKKAFKS